MNNAEALLTVRLVLHVLTVLLLASYCKPEAKFRLGPSIMAGLLLSASAGMAAQIILEWAVLVKKTPQPQLTLFVFTVFLPIAWAKGNVAKIYDWLNRSAHSSWWTRR